MEKFVSIFRMSIEFFLRRLMRTDKGRTYRSNSVKIFLYRIPIYSQFYLNYKQTFKIVKQLFCATDTRFDL